MLIRKWENMLPKRVVQAGDMDGQMFTQYLID